MSMFLLLCRHGNTFGPGEKVVWVGARTDLPLTGTGVAQAAEIGQALVRNGIVLARICAGPLLRTRQTAEVLAAAIGLARDRVETVQALAEIDYGTWEGKSDAEIRASGAGPALAGWQSEAVWPAGCQWSPDAAVIVQRMRALIARLDAETPAGGVVALISSNGVFRLLAKDFGVAPAGRKMATGAISLVRVDRDSTRVLAWNVKPAAFAMAGRR
jgi:probable phosphoglycerate mutase